MIRIAVHGDVDPHRVDGSAAWLTPLVEALSVGPCRTDVFLEAREESDPLSERLSRLRGVTCISSLRGERLQDPTSVLHQIALADSEHRYDAILLGGTLVCREAARRDRFRSRLWTVITELPQDREAMDEATANALGEIAEASRFVWCQTEELRTLLESLVPSVCRKTVLLPPRISESVPEYGATAPAALRSAYERHLKPILERMGSTPAADRKTILVAGHDLKFASGIMGVLEARGHRVLVDLWSGHSRHDTRQSARRLAEADAVWCEWCLGNAVWYSRRVSPGQPLIVRMHAQELRTDFPRKVRTKRVTRIVFVGEHLRNEARAAFGWSDDRLVVIPNAIDPIDLGRTKLPDAEYHLGMIGICPALKGFDRALDVLESLQAADSRFTLHIKGKMPWDYEWLWKRPEERAYFEAAFDRVRRSPRLAQSVVFDGFGPDVAAWLRKIGCVLSLSDRESFHLAIPEGAASGAIPIVLPWSGAEHLYPRDWIVRDVPEASHRIRELMTGGHLPERRRQVRDYVVDRFSVDRIASDFEALLLGAP